VREVVRAFFFDQPGKLPSSIRLHLVRDEVLACGCRPTCPTSPTRQTKTKALYAAGITSLTNSSGSPGETTMVLPG
jgi:hypothetical protein